MTSDVLLLVNTAATWVMVGVIWFVQLVHYPMLARYADFPAAEREHQRRTSWVVFPPMAAELLTSVLLVVARPDSAALWAGGGLVAVWGFSTALVQVPLHDRLSAGFDPALHRRLVRTNWVRTIAWTVRGLLTGWLLYTSRSSA
jgi:hypothetical protein